MLETLKDIIVVVFDIDGKWCFYEVKKICNNN